MSDKPPQEAFPYWELAKGTKKEFRIVSNMSAIDSDAHTQVMTLVRGIIPRGTTLALKTRADLPTPKGFVEKVGATLECSLYTVEPLPGWRNMILRVLSYLEAWYYIR
jgi:hypothetical protein